MVNENVQFSETAEDFLKLKEGFEPMPYLCPANKWTVGYGTTKRAKVEWARLNGPISEEKATEWMLEDIEEAGDAVKRVVTVPLNDNQFSALVLWTQNVGIKGMATSTLVRILNRGDYDGVPAQLARWNKITVKKNGRKVKVVSNGLVKRRAEEAAIWATSTEDLPRSMPQAVEEDTKPLPKSRTVWGAIVAGAGAAVPVIEEVKGLIVDQADNLHALQNPSDWVPWLIGLLGVSGAALALYARWDDRQKGRN